MERDALGQHFLLGTKMIASVQRRDLCRAFADVSVLEEGGMHNRQGELGASRKTEG